MMGFDVVAFVNGIWQSQYGLLALLSGALFIALWISGFFGRLFRIIEEMMFSNWQLALLGATAIALSLASGYTTFDGLRNFTSAPLLSVLIAFGIQGVMLIVAWLIGESFATGMNQRSAGGRGFTAREATIGMVLGVALAGLAFYWLLNQYSAVGFTRASGLVADWGRFADVALYFLIALVLVAVIAFNFRRGGDISVPYVQSVRLIAKNSVLWVMFLASMAASVFFSFDSHFNAIFPAEQKKRAAEIRTLNQVGRAVADIGERAQKVQLAEAERLFETDGWKAYDAHLTKLTQQAQGSQGEIERYFVTKMEERRRGIAEQQERISGAERNQTALLRRRDELEAELQRIEPSIGAFEAELAKAQGTANATKQAIAAKRIEANAEDGGVEGTLKRGRGPIYRQRMAEAEELQRKLSITDEPRLREAQRQRDQASARIVSLKREIATINGDVAKYKGETQTAAQRIKAAESSDGDAEGTKVDPARVLPAFERARSAFRQQPDTERLAGLQTQCGNLLNAMLSTPAAKERVRAIDCDPNHAAEAAARLFALNAGLVAFQSTCAGGSRLPQNATTDELLSFGRKCLQDSGLVSQESTDLGARLQAIDMNRDDKAHRFVVTWNAFQDGNRLAYLALVLAIGVDALVFMAGLFGAASVKSPLSDVPSFKARSAEQLQAVIDTALLPHTYENARAVLNAMRPMAPDGGFTQRITVRDDDPHAPDLHRILNAGATIGAVRHVAGENYELRSELFEYISLVAKKAFAADKSHVALADLERIVAVALLPDVKDNVETVLKYVHPIEDKPTFLEKVGVKERPDFTAEIELGEVDRSDKKVVRNALNAGASMEAVQRVNNSHYFISRDFYKTLARIRGRFLVSAAPDALMLRDAGNERLIGAGANTSTVTPLVTDNLRTHRGSLADNRGRLLENHHPGNGRADHDLETSLRLELVKPLGVSAASLDHIWEPEVAGEALAAANALKRQARQRPALNSELRLVESDSRRVLEQAQDILAAQYQGDRHTLSLLHDVAAEIDRRIPALMLLPEGGLIDRLIYALEEASGDNRLSDDEHLLLSRLQKLKGDLEVMRLNDSSAWKGIARQLDHLNEPAPAPTHRAGQGQVH
jgi:hypothetical protein